ncbi:ATP-binding cassette domain-containing protein [Desulfopila sp. IMCC35006]|uniref:energy-coupling factor ABC transporter ATP-binding protein n=1 Tax=Desulfopila sp. IMCC35006 TaxID=2569542 RepID=UPI0010ACCA96|nr:ATP-binding cassette domain-containing protein [Desulfopila sp. IMCC35006]TKB26910.1 ATP-binding cassette domain-containing protein [Desulfopila sp. IMCC35006]
MLYSLENLTRKHGDRTVLHIDKLDIEPEQIYTLIGPNGAGKTSLLQILAFLDQPSSGRMHFLDKEVSFDQKQLYALRRQVVLLDQTPIMFTGSVRQNVEFGLQVRKVARTERRQRIEEALELVGMERFADYDAQGLSGGETKRVALARALVLQPEVLLCDEPTANVDNENQEIILKIIDKINQEHKASVIFSTHYLAQGQRLAHQTLLLQNGELADVASENIYRVTVVERREDTLVCQLTGQLFLTLPHHILPDAVQTAKLQIDPNGVILNPKTTNPAEGNLLSGHITDLAQDSGRIRVVINVGVRLVLVLPMTQYRQEKPGIGEKMQIFIPHSSMYCRRINLTR